MSKIAIYPGSFDPITIGHFDIIKRGSKEFDTVVVTVLKNSKKPGLFSIEERISFIKKLIKEENLTNVKVDCFEGLLADYMKKEKATILMRGLRTSEDFSYEQQLYMINKDLNDKFETHYFMANPLLVHCSSSVVRELLHYGRDISNYEPKSIINDIIKKASEK